MGQDTNIVVLSGNLCRDAEVRTFQSGGKVCNFSMAVNDDYKNKQTGEEVKKAAFIDVACFTGTADFIATNGKKGVKVLVEGKITQDSWQDKDTGQKRTKLKINATRVQIVGVPRGGLQNAAQPQRPQTPAESVAASEAPLDIPEEEIPF